MDKVKTVYGDVPMNRTLYSNRHNPETYPVDVALEYINPHSKVIDFGAGYGGPAKMMLDKGCNVTCVENDPECVEYIKSTWDVDLVDKDMRSFEFEERYDVAFLFASLMYLPFDEKRILLEKCIDNCDRVIVQDFVSKTNDPTDNVQSGYVNGRVQLFVPPRQFYWDVFDSCEILLEQYDPRFVHSNAARVLRNANQRGSIQTPTIVVPHVDSQIENILTVVHTNG